MLSYRWKDMALSTAIDVWIYGRPCRAVWPEVIHIPAVQVEERQGGVGCHDAQLRPGLAEWYGSIGPNKR